jgi:hypothetical protein
MEQADSEFQYRVLPPLPSFGEPIWFNNLGPYVIPRKTASVVHLRIVSFGGRSVLTTIFTVLLSGLMLAMITVVSTGVLIHAQVKLERQQTTAANTEARRPGRSK